jgi:hypothetical protein
LILSISSHQRRPLCLPFIPTGSPITGVKIGIPRAFALLAVLVIGDVLFVHPHHPVFVWHKIPAYMAGIGVGAAILLSLFSKGLGYLFLYRKEDYDDR